MKRERMLQVAVGLLYVALIYPLSRIKANFSDAQEELSWFESIRAYIYFSACTLFRLWHSFRQQSWRSHSSYDSNFDRRARWTSVAAICSVSV